MTAEETVDSIVIWVKSGSEMVDVLEDDDGRLVVECAIYSAFTKPDTTIGAVNVEYIMEDDTVWVTN